MQSRQWQTLRSFPFRLAIGYFVIGAAYIAFSDDLVRRMFSDPVQLTHIQNYKGWGFVTVSAVLIFLVTAHFVRSVVRAEASLASARLDYRRLVETTGEGVQVTDRNGTTIFVNDRLCELAGTARELLLADGLAPLIAGPSADGAFMPHDEVQILRPDGGRVWAIVTETPMTDPGGVRSGTLRVYTDNTDRRLATDELARALQTQRVLTSELDHRVRNNLASLVAMIGLTSNGRPELASFARTVTGRISTMAGAYTLLSASRWQPVDLRSIIAEVTAPAEERRSLEGPEVRIGMEQVVPLMLVLHELISNTREHGSLRSPAGRVDVRWRVDRPSAPASPALVIEWTERGGAPIAGTFAGGTGLAIAKGLAGSDLRGGLDCAFPPEGARITLTVGTGVVAANGAAERAGTGRTGGTAVGSPCGEIGGRL